jgi:hypothetical protein
MEWRAIRLLEMGAAGEALKLAPGAATRVAISADVASAHPAVVGTRVVGTELLLCIDCAAASGAGELWWECGGGVETGCVGVHTRATERLVDEARKGVPGVIAGKFTVPSLSAPIALQ